jgi:hypothetical protein
MWNMIYRDCCSGDEFFGIGGAHIFQQAFFVGGACWFQVVGLRIVAQSFVGCGSIHIVTGKAGHGVEACWS